MSDSLLRASSASILPLFAPSMEARASNDASRVSSTLLLTPVLSHDVAPPVGRTVEVKSVEARLAEARERIKSAQRSHGVEMAAPSNASDVSDAPNASMRDEVVAVAEVDVVDAPAAAAVAVQVAHHVGVDSDCTTSTVDEDRRGVPECKEQQEVVQAPPPAAVARPTEPVVQSTWGPCFGLSLPPTLHASGWTSTVMPSMPASAFSSWYLSLGMPCFDRNAAAASASTAVSGGEEPMLLRAMQALREEQDSAARLSLQLVDELNRGRRVPPAADGDTPPP